MSMSVAHPGASRPSSWPRCGGSRRSIPTRAGALLPVLHMAQETFGYVSLEAEEYVAGSSISRPRTCTRW